MPARQSPLLTSDELLALDEALLDHYRSHERLCVDHPIALGRISRPAIPAALSEGLVALLTPLFFSEGASAGRGGRLCDLIVDLPGSESQTVEVKASGQGRWQEVKPRDLAADAFVWVDFGDRYVRGHGPIEVHFLPDPRRYELPRPKIVLDLFLRDAETIEGFRTERFASLAEVIARAPVLTQTRHAQLALD